jgi:hypothetical protein
VVNVDQWPFGGVGGPEPLVLLAANLEFIRAWPWCIPFR